MKRQSVVKVLVGVGLVLILALAIGASAQQDTGSAASPEDESDVPVANVIPERYQPRSDAAAAAAETVYFTPQDNTDNTTVLSLYNTSSSDANVSLETFRLDGSLLVDQTVLVPAGEMVRIASDIIVTPAPGDWDQAIYIQFFNTSAFARLTLPEGVMADAYIAWTNTLDFDPSAVVSSFSLRFSTDPASVFLPVTINQ